jgi:hypothetical protein
MGKPLALLFDPFESLVSLHKGAFGAGTHLNHAGLVYLWYVPCFKFRLKKSDAESFVVQVMTYVMDDGKSNYLEGIVLLCKSRDCLWRKHLSSAGLYIIIAVSFWFYPGTIPRVVACSVLTVRLVVWSLSSSLAVCKAT